MRTPYVVGERRNCADCGDAFTQEVHRRAYCIRCRRRRNRESMSKMTARKRAPGGGSYGKLPGNTRISRTGQREKVLRKTYKTRLPFCPVCHHYGMCSEHQKVVYG